MKLGGRCGARRFTRLASYPADIYSEQTMLPVRRLRSQLVIDTVNFNSSAFSLYAAEVVEIVRTLRCIGLGRMGKMFRDEDYPAVTAAGSY